MIPAGLFASDTCVSLNLPRRMLGEARAGPLHRVELLTISRGKKMADTACNYQRIVSVEEVRCALEEAQCQHCGITTNELMSRGELLEICGEELCSDISTGKKTFITLALCPSCHKHAHQDAENKHNPCQIKARWSREGLA